MNHAHRDNFFITSEAGEIGFGADRREGAAIDFRSVAQVIEAARCLAHCPCQLAPPAGFPRHRFQYFAHRRQVEALRIVYAGVTCGGIHGKIVASRMSDEGEGRRRLPRAALGAARDMQRDAAIPKPPCDRHQGQGIEAGIGGAALAGGCAAARRYRKARILGIDDKSMRGKIGAHGIGSLRLHARQDQRAPRREPDLASTKNFGAAYRRVEHVCVKTPENRANPEAVSFVDAEQSNRTRLLDSVALSGWTGA